MSLAHVLSDKNTREVKSSETNYLSECQKFFKAYKRFGLALTQCFEMPVWKCELHHKTKQCARRVRAQETPSLINSKFNNERMLMNTRMGLETKN